MALTPRIDWLVLADAELEAEVDIRLELHSRMIGKLYPAILLGEVSELRHILTKRRAARERIRG